MTDGAPSARNRQIPDDVVAEARRLYEAGEIPSSEIARRLKISRGSVTRLAQSRGWRRRAAGRAALIGRIRARVETELDQVERIMADGGSDAQGLRAAQSGQDSAERSARTLSSLVKTLRELAGFDADRARAAAAGRADDDAAGREDSYDGFGNLDELREALADRLERLRAKHEP